MTNDPMTLPASEETVPATDENILALEELLEDQLPPWSGCANTLRSLIARIRSEREQAVRDCAEIAGTQRGETADGQYTWWEVSNNIRNRLLSLIDRSAKT